MSSEKSLLATIFGTIWRFINGARLIVLNAIFFLFLYLFLLVLFDSDGTLIVKQSSALLLNPRGAVVEQYSGSPLDRALLQAAQQTQPETRLRDLLEAIRRAEKDDRITLLVVDPGELWSIGLASLLELEQAIEQFKSSGKSVIALADHLSQSQYYLASLADEVWLHSEGMLWIDGFSAYRNFYRDGLDMLQVEINLFRVGEYKSAMEPFVRNDMSAEAREANLYWIGSLWQQYLEGISRNRGVPLEQLSEGINDFANRLEGADGNFGQLAFEAGLVDRLVNRPEANQLLARMTGPGEGSEGYRQIDFMNYLAVSRPQDVASAGKEIAIIVAEGPIVRGLQPQGLVGAESLTRSLRSLGRNKNVAAVVVRINSPGGDAFASERLRRELQALRDSGKTVVVSMGDVAASGGYWIAMGADEIWASPSTITGSIGVTGMVPTFSRTLAKLGIYADGVGTTALAGKLRSDMPMEEDLKRIFQSATERTYEDFIKLVAVARGMDQAEIRQVAGGRVWSGSQASERGLIDQTGSLKQAIDAAARIAGLGGEYRTRYVESEMSAFESLLVDFTASAAVRLNLVPALDPVIPLGIVDELLSDLRLLGNISGRFSLAAHCFCDFRHR